MIASFPPNPEGNSLRSTNLPSSNLGRAELIASTRGNRTVISHQYSRAPLQWLGPLDPESDFQQLYIRNPNGGLLGGDAQSISLQLQEMAAVELCTQSATRIHPGLSRQVIDIELEENSSLIWIGHPVILGTGTQFEQTVNVKLSKMARLAYAEVWAAGRLAMSQEFAPAGVREQERWRFKRLSNRMRVDRDDSPLLREAIASDYPHAALTSTGVLGSYLCWGSLYLFGDWPEIDWPEEEFQWSVESAAGDRILRRVGDRSMDIWHAFQACVPRNR